MKITKILAGMSALAIAAATSIPAFAEKTIVDETNLDYIEVKESDGVYQYYVDLAKSPYDPATVSAVKFTFSVDDSAGFGGGLMLNSNKSGWDQKDEWKWANPGADNAQIFADGSDGSYTLTFDFGALGEEYWGSPADGENYWAQVVCQLWWGNDVTVTNVEIVGDEKAEAPESKSESAAESKAEETSSTAADSSSSNADSASSSKAATTNNNTKNATTTGNNASSAAAASDNTNQATGATTGFALAGLALAGAIAVVSKKKN